MFLRGFPGLRGRVSVPVSRLRGHAFPCLFLCLRGRVAPVGNTWGEGEARLLAFCAVLSRPVPRWTDLSRLIPNHRSDDSEGWGPFWSRPSLARQAAGGLESSLLFSAAVPLHRRTPKPIKTQCVLSMLP